MPLTNHWSGLAELRVREELEMKLGIKCFSSANRSPLNASVRRLVLHLVTFNLEGIVGPGGFISETREGVVSFAVPLAETALNQLGDKVNALEWYDLSGSEQNPRELLTFGDHEEAAKVIGQISDYLKADTSGYIDLWAYSSFFDLVREHDVERWCSTNVKLAIKTAREAYAEAIESLSRDWECA